MEKLIVALIKTDGKFLLLLNRGDDSVAGFKSVQEALKSFEDSYHRAHARSYEGSMSACINFITFQPSIVEFDSLDDLRDKLFDDDNYSVVTSSNVSGSVTGLLCADKAEKVFKSGVTPSLIHR